MNKEIGDGQKQVYLSEILPKFDSSSEVLMRAVKSKEALENYSRYCLQNTTIPDQVIPQFERLKEAIGEIQPVSPVDRSEILSTYPELKAHVELLDHCLKHYADVMQGEMHYVDVLYPEGNVDSSEASYLNPESDYINAAISELIVNYIQAVGRPTHLLEVGGGMGTCTRHILPRIRNLPCQYLFTDLGAAFVRRAQKLFDNYENVTYLTYNVETAPPDTFIVYDVVLGVNVLHATADILVTLENMRKLVQPGGMLVLHEITERSDHATLTAGMTTGWWAYTDNHRIPHSPLISPNSWVKLLHQSGFNEVRLLPAVDRHIIIGV